VGAGQPIPAFLRRAVQTHRFGRMGRRKISRSGRTRPAARQTRFRIPAI